MFVSGFNIDLQVAVSIQLCKELCNRATTHVKSIQSRFISWNLIKSQMLHAKYQNYV